MMFEALIFDTPHEKSHMVCILLMAHYNGSCTRPDVENLLYWLDRYPPRPHDGDHGLCDPSPTESPHRQRRPLRPI